MNLDCTICGATSETEIGGVPVCLDCFHSMQEGEYDQVKESVMAFTREIPLEYIERVVCDYFGITPEEIEVKKRDRNIVLPRQLCHHFSKEMTKKSLSEIGWRFGRKDHATVLHSTKTINNLRETNKSFRAKYEELVSKF